MLVSVLMPTRRRPELALEAVRSFLRMTRRFNQVEFLFRLDDDDKGSGEKIREELRVGFPNEVNYKIIYGERRRGYADLHLAVNDLCEIATGEWFLLFNDDALMTTMNWDDVFFNLPPQVDPEFALLKFFDGYGEVEGDEANGINSWTLFPCIRRGYYDLLKHFSLQTHNDTWVELVHRPLGLLHYFPQIKIKHNRFLESGENDDQVFRDGQKAYPETTPEFFSKKYAELRELDIAQIRSVIQKRIENELEESTIYVIYKCYYGEDFIKESVESVLPYVDRVLLYMADRPFGDVKQVEYKGKEVVFPRPIDNIIGVVAELQEKYGEKKIQYFDEYRPDNRDHLRYIVEERVLANFIRPDYLIYMEPDMVWRSDQFEGALATFHQSRAPYGLCKQVELWKEPKYRIPERQRWGVMFYNMNAFKEFPETGRDGSPVNQQCLVLPQLVHNLGFCVCVDHMYWKHLLAIAFAAPIEEAHPNPTWYEDKWLTWDEWKNNYDLEISLGHEKEIHYAHGYPIKDLPLSISKRFYGL
jgi:hypothetical protein